MELRESAGCGQFDSDLRGCEWKRACAVTNDSKRRENLNDRVRS